ncbi:ABC transporter ATP-binding protein [Pseudonocardia ailaonensis]
MAGGKVTEDLRKGDEGWSDLLHPPTVTAATVTAVPAAARVEPVRAEPVGSGPAGLDAKGLRITYGRFTAVHGADIAVRPASLTVLVGTNGAGKSSVLNAIAGLRPPAAGSVAIDGVDVTRRPAHERVGHGLVLVPSGRALFASLTVAENLRLSAGAEEEGAIDPLELFPELRPKLGQRAGTMSGGEQQMLAVARSLRLRPRYLLIDELSLGLSPAATGRLVDALLEIRDQGVGILVVEQNAPFALSYSDEAYVMNRGQVAFHGPSAEAAARPDLFRPVFLDTA